jgi:hypothetical protein
MATSLTVSRLPNTRRKNCRPLSQFRREALMVSQRTIKTHKLLRLTKTANILNTTCWHSQASPRKRQSTKETSQHRNSTARTQSQRQSVSKTPSPGKWQKPSPCLSSQIDPHAGIL